jgi:hypothetical protein
MTEVVSGLGKTAMSESWLWRFLLPFLTFLVIAVVGRFFIHNEPFRTLWVLASGGIAAVIWLVVFRLLSR